MVPSPAHIAQTTHETVVGDRSNKNLDISSAGVEGKRSFLRELLYFQCSGGGETPSKPFLFVLCELSLYVLSQLKMTSKQRFSVNCHSSLTVKVTEENVFEADDNVEEEPDYESSSSDENETLSVDPQAGGHL